MAVINSKDDKKPFGSNFFEKPAIDVNENGTTKGNEPKQAGHWTPVTNQVTRGPGGSSDASVDTAWDF